MAAPNLTIDVQPSESGKALFLPLAPSSKGTTAQFKLILRLTITNHELKTVHVTGIKFSFPGSGIASATMKAVSFDVGVGSPAIWWNGRVELADGSPAKNFVFRNMPAPEKVRISLTASTFSTPAVFTLPLIPFKGPAPSKGVLFPLRAEDLRVGEYFMTAGVHTGDSDLGIQIFAHDIGCHGYDEGTGLFQDRLPGKDKSKNAHYRIWDKPVRAVADGIVQDFLDGIPNNPTGQNGDPDGVDKGLGNYFGIIHGDLVVLYCHLKKGTLRKQFKAGNAPVKAGDILAHAGSSGHSNGVPHLHVEGKKFFQLDQKNRPLRGMPFRDMWLLRTDKLDPPSPAGPWVEAKAQGVCQADAYIWPAKSKPAWYAPGSAELAFWGIPAAEYQDKIDHTDSSGYRPVWVDGFEVDDEVYYNLLCRPKDGTRWAARHGMDRDEYQTEFNKKKKDGLRLLNITSYVFDDDVHYAAIWTDTPMPKGHFYHGRSEDYHHAHYKKYKKDGYVPINISVAAPDGDRIYSAYYEKRNVGEFTSHTSLTDSEYQKLATDSDKAGRHIAYLSAYQLDGEPRFCAIFQEKLAGTGNTVSRHNMNRKKMKAESDKWLTEKGLLTRVIAGYERDGKGNYAAAWRKAPAGALQAASGLG